MNIIDIKNKTNIYKTFLLHGAYRSTGAPAPAPANPGCFLATPTPAPAPAKNAQ